METFEARQANRSAVLAAIAAAGQTTRTQVADSTGLSPATVSRVADGLIAEGLISDGPAVASGRPGRSATALEPAPGLGLVAGVDLGGSNCRVLVADMRGMPVEVTHERTPVSIGAAALADWLAGQVTGLSAKVAQRAPLRAVTVGLPGTVTPDGTTIGAAPNLPQIEGQFFARKLQRAIAAPVQLYNDSDLALLGELRFGAGLGLRRAVMFTIGTGLGAGVTLDGTTLVRGARGLTGEFGYLPTGPSGERAEELVSGSGVLAQAQALRADVLDAAEVFDGREAGLLAPVLERFDRGLELILIAAAVAYDPEAIIIGGGLSPAVARHLDRTRAALARRLPVPPDVRLTKLGDLAGTLGAVVAATQSAYQSLGVAEADAAALPPVTRELSRLWKGVVDVSPGQAAPSELGSRPAG
jgi:predicted NBD/HSP70 family sugar kinase